jgi:hypothetical protein
MNITIVELYQEFMRFPCVRPWIRYTLLLVAIFNNFRFTFLSKSHSKFLWKIFNFISWKLWVFFFNNNENRVICMQSSIHSEIPRLILKNWSRLLVIESSHSLWPSWSLILNYPILDWNCPDFWQCESTRPIIILIILLLWWQRFIDTLETN